MMKVKFVKLLLAGIALCSTLAAVSQDIKELKLKDFRPESIYKIQRTETPRAKYPAIDIHTHDYVKTAAELDEWVRLMDECNIEKSIIQAYTTGAAFDSVVQKFSKYKDRFEIWCGFDYTGVNEPGWDKKAVAELERCYKMGARGVGELGDKGMGELYSEPTPGYGVHIDDVRLRPLLKRCAELKMPVSVHVAEDEWMYRNIDSTNDGLMNAAEWKVDMTVKGKLDHDQLVATLANAAKNNPSTTFVACHLANSCSDLSQLGKLFDLYPNLYADISARYGEIAPVPRYTRQFIEKYQDRVLYGTDMTPTKKMYSITFRILETADEHFYEVSQFNYHWPYYGLSLNEQTLKKLYGGNARKILKR